MIEQDLVALASAKKSWRFRRRIKRLLLGWFFISLIFAEAGASWFGILLARHAPMSLAEARVLGVQVAMGVFVISFLILVVTIALQFNAR